MRYKRLSILIVVLMVVSFVLVGCPAEDVDPDPDPDPDPVDPDPDPDPEEVTRVTVAQGDTQISWDPPQDWTSVGEWTIQNAYDYLFMRSADAAEWVPQLAYDWEVIDELTFRFYLEEGVTFHDGTELTAEDVKYHYRRVIDGPRELYIVTGQYDWIDEMEVIDEYTLDIRSHEPDSRFLWQLAQTNNGAGIVSKAYVEEVGPEGVHSEPMGSGPYELKDWSRDEYVLFEAYDDYWQGEPEIEELEFRIIPEASTRVAELLTGGVDVAFDMMYEDKDRIEAEEGITTEEVPSAQGWMLFPRIGVHPEFEGDPELDREFTTADPRIRKAIELAIDKYALREIDGGIGEAFRARLFEPLPEANPELFGPEANLYDPERAQELIEEAGYEPGEAYLHFDAMEDPPAGDLARVIDSMLTDVGFDVDLNVMDESTFRSEVYHPRRTQELMLHDLGGQMNPFFGTNIFHSDRLETTDYGGIGSSPEGLDELLETAWTEVEDEEKRIEAYHEAGMMIAEERLNIGLFQRTALWGLNERIDWTPRYDNDIYGWDMAPAE